MVKKYYKICADGYLICTCFGYGGTEEITEEEYNRLNEIIANKPAAPEGHAYRITEAGEYVLVEIVPPPEPDDNDELTKDEAFDIIMGGAV